MSSTPPIWRKIQKENFTCLQTLAQFLELDKEQQAVLYENRHFPLNLPRRLAEKIQKKTFNDPIFKQFVPVEQETIKMPFFIQDPVGDCKSVQSPKCLQKYAGRVLLLTTGACAMNCRFCFRQNFSYAPLQEGFSQELAVIQKDLSIKEVILSGGDPLSMSNRQLQELFDSLAAVSHLQRIRFHTRFPLGIPERIDSEFLSIIERSPKQVWFVIHCNHPIELDSEVLLALKKIRRLGIPVLNQCVLLQGVNDSIDTLQALFETLIDQGIMPYYLHQLDRVEGAAHFEVSQEKGCQLIAELNKRLPGYGVPKYVQEIYGEPSKTAITHLKTTCT